MQKLASHSRCNQLYESIYGTHLPSTCKHTKDITSENTYSKDHELFKAILDMIEDPLICDEILYKMRQVKNMRTTNGAFQFLMADFKPSYESQMSEGGRNQKNDAEIMRYSNWCFDINMPQSKKDTGHHKRGINQDHATVSLIEKINLFLSNSVIQCCMNELKSELDNPKKCKSHSAPNLSFRSLKHTPQKKQRSSAAA